MPSSISSSDAAAPKAKDFLVFDPDHVDRPVPERPWRGLAFAALAATVALTLGWEAYWRGKGFTAGDFNNSEALWAQERRKAKGAATVIIGSSRIFFGIDLDVWEDVSGVRPIQLALEGTSPRIFLKDLASDEDFRGTVIVGVTAPLFFTSDGGLRAGALTYARDESPSQRADQILARHLERIFAYIDEQTRPKRQLAIAPFPLRDGMRPRFDPRKLESLEADRNTQLWARVADDEAYREEAKAQWQVGTTNYAPPPGPDGAPPPPMPDALIDTIIAEVKANIDAIRARGGEVAFMRMPYGGDYTAVEDFGFPRARFWDRLVRDTGSVGIAWQDHPQLQGYELPEWSHLSASEAERYTRAAVPILYKALNGRSDAPTSN